MTDSLAIDSSVIVKWFKKGEESEAEALRLRQEILSTTTMALTSELVPLEVCRALTKVGYERKKVDEVYKALNEMYDLGFLETIPTVSLKDEAKDLIVCLSLYVADAISLASAIESSSNLLTEDKHLLKQGVQKRMEKRGLKVTNLKDFYR